MTQTLAAFGPELLQSGIFPGVPKEAAPLWHDAENVSFWNGRVLSAPGFVPTTDIRRRIYSLAQTYTQEGARRGYAIDELRRVIMWEEGEPATVIGRVDNLRAQMVPFGDALIVVERGNPVRTWFNRGSLERVKDGPQAAYGLRHGQYVLLFNTRKGRNFIEWSHFSDILTWEPAHENDARDLPLRHLDSGISAAAHLGNSIGVYTHESIVVVDWKGHPAIYGETRRIDGIGVEAPGCVVEVGFLNFGFSRFGIFQTDGNQFERVDTAALGTLLENEVDWTRAWQISGLHHKAREEVLWFYHDKQGVRRGIGVNYKTGAFSKYRMPVYAAAPRDVFDAPLVSTLRGPAYFQGETTERCWVRSKPIDAGNPMLYKFWEIIRVSLKGRDVSLKVGLHDEIGGDPHWVYDDRVYNTVTLPPTYQESAYITLEFYTENRGNLEIAQLLLSGEPGGPVL